VIGENYPPFTPKNAVELCPHAKIPRECEECNPPVKGVMLLELHDLPDLQFGHKLEQLRQQGILGQALLLDGTNADRILAHLRERELLLCEVEQKVPGQTRFQTALSLIRKAQRGSDQAQQSPPTPPS